MSTKTIVIGEKVVKTKQKPICFEKCLDMVNNEFFLKRSEYYIPSDYNYLELISKDYFKGYDLIFGYNDPEQRSNGCLYIGHWNDGVVE